MQLLLLDLFSSNKNKFQGRKNKGYFHSKSVFFRGSTFLYTNEENVVKESYFDRFEYIIHVNPIIMLIIMFSQLPDLCS